MALEAGGPVQRLASLEVMGASASMISMSAIEERVRRLGGQLITAKDIESRRARRLEDALRGVPGLSVAPAATIGDRAVSSRGQRDLRSQACSPMYFLDGAMTDGPLDQASLPVLVEEIRAIEVYTGANMPVEYHREGGLCGAIAVWTKRRIEEGMR
jgi:outer membrane receptor for Fe3+-dicitrate